jgi:branched-chain amino acid transport system permease protein
VGSIVGTFFCAAVIRLMPIALRALPAALDLTIPSKTIDQLTTKITGVLIIESLIVEPRGLARLWQTVEHKLRVWPLPY